jgi:hypothetical protein
MSGFDPPQDDLNPYRSPQAEAISAGAAALHSGVPVWLGKVVVVPREFRFPPRCVVCNEAAELHRFKLEWAPFVGFRKRLVLFAGECRAHRERRRNAAVAGSSFVAIGALAGLTPFTLELGALPALSIVGLFLIFAGLLILDFSRSPLRAARIDVKRRSSQVAGCTARGWSGGRRAPPQLSPRSVTREAPSVWPDPACCPAAGFCRSCLSSTRRPQPCAAASNPHTL